MLYVSQNLRTYTEFLESFRKSHSDKEIIDLSKLQSSTLADECSAIVDHHKSCAIIFGYLEPGWMLEPQHQTRLRKVFRKFPVAMVTRFVESIPYSWKNEIDTIYMFKP